MAAASQICYTSFDAAFFKLPALIQKRIESKIDEMGLRFKTFPHVRLTGHDRYRLRVGDYRIIYTLDLEQNVIHLLAVGNRREIYRNY